MPTILGNIATISRCVSEYRNKRIGEKIAGIYHRYILTVTANPGMSQDDIAKKLCINKSSTTRHLTTLEEHGYITRTPSIDDKRKMLVYPTEKAIEIFPKVLSVKQECNRLLEEGIDEKELEIFHKVLDAIAHRARDIMYSEDDTE